jgi:hypothetical protein
MSIERKRKTPFSCSFPGIEPNGSNAGMHLHFRRCDRVGVAITASLRFRTHKEKARPAARFLMQL